MVFAPTPEQLKEARTQQQEEQEEKLLAQGYLSKEDADSVLRLNQSIIRNGSLNFELNFVSEDKTLKIIQMAHLLTPYNSFVRSLITQYSMKNKLTDKQMTALHNIIVKHRAVQKQIKTTKCPHCKKELGYEMRVLDLLNQLEEKQQQQKKIAAKKRFDQLI